MRHDLLSRGGKFYKANLHCHSVISDGTLTPEELKARYRAQGYSIIAYTDHDLFIPHHDLTDEAFLALAGYEVELNETRPASPDRKTAHICFVAGSPDMTIQPCWNEKYCTIGNSKNYIHLVQHDPAQTPFERDHTPECVNAMMRAGRDAGFFVTYNHPTWSQEFFEDYSRYEGMHAMEIFNTECQNLGYESYEPGIYDDLLRAGRRIFAVAADDNHNKRPGDSFGGFVMIKAEKLEYKTITDAMFRGDFYASQGPEIYDLYVEDGEICVTCSDAAHVSLNTGRRSAKIVHAPDGGTVNEARFTLREGDPFFRITVTDRFGKHANSRAYFPEEWA